MNVHQTIDQLRRLDVQDVVVETVNVFTRKKRPHTMIYRGCEYEHAFTTESKIRFAVSDQNAASAGDIVAHAAMQ